MKTAVLFLAHFVNDEIINRFHKLQNELPPEHTLFWVFQSDNGNDSTDIQHLGSSLFFFNLDNLNSMGYPHIERLYGNEHRIMEYFFRTNPEYDFYWCIEYDVIFTGRWSVLFNHFSGNDADLLSSHIEHRSYENSHWGWWNHIKLINHDSIELIKSFNPIYRISARGLRSLDSFLKEGNDGFYEVIIATSLHNTGARLEDLGGTGEFVTRGNRNRFYVQGAGVNNGTMRWKPEFLKEEIQALGTRDRLFHPLK